MNTVYALVRRSCLFVFFTFAPTVLFALGAVPTIYSFNPTSGTNGTIVAIRGVNFGSYPSNNIVYFGAVRATVLSAGLSNLTVRVPVGATYAPITVLANDLIGYSGKPFEPTFAGNGGAFDSMSFAPAIKFAMPNGPQQVAIGDLDGDGKPDLVVNNVYAHNVSIFRNISSSGLLSSNSFAARVDLPALYPADNTDNPYGVTLADVDCDGKLDIVTFDQDNNKIIVYKNISSAGTLDTNSFAPPVYFDSAATPRSVLVADIDGDGRPDIVYSAAGAGAVSVLQNIGTAGVINSNSFAPHVEFAAGAVPVNTAIGDLDGDGRLDVVAANYNGDSVSVLRNVSLPGTINSNSFAPAINLPTPSGGAAIALGDIDGDGKIDLVVGSVGHTLSLFQNKATLGISSNSFGSRVDFPTPGIPHTIALSDLNGDGKADIALVSELNSALSIWENVSTPGSLTTNSLAPRVDYTAGYNAWGVAVGDLDGDGRPDIAFGNAYDATMWVYQNTSAFAGTTVSNTAPVVTSQPTNQIVPAGSLATFSVTATGSPPLRYQWYTDFNRQPSLILGATNSTFSIGASQATVGAYFAVVSNPFGSTTSSNASLTLIGIITNLPPIITKQPTNQTVSAGGTVMFSVAASGSLPLHYQWYGAQGPIPGAVSSAYGISNVQPGDAGAYYVIVTNLYGSAMSSNAILTVIGGTNTGSCTPPPSGIVAWWRAENNALDSVGTNNGTINGGVGFKPGEVGQAFYFGGTNGYISVPASSNLDVGKSGGMTIEGWIKPDHLGPIGAEGRPIVEYDTSSAVGVHFFFESGYTLYANIVDVSNVSHPVQSAPGTIVTNALQHVAVTYDKTSGNCLLYINGTQVALANFGNITPQTSYPLSIGLRAANGFPGSGSFYNGLLDELSIYNRALSQAEIQAIYNAGSEGKCTSSTISNLPPVITHQPTNQTVAVGGAAYFALTATGSPPLRYQWFYTWQPPNPSSTAIEILGATNSTLIRSNVQPNQAGYYFATVRNAYGLAVSSNAVLTVIGGTNSGSCTPPPSGLVGWWPGESNADDVIGGDNGTLEGGATFAPGKVGEGFRLDGTNGFVQIPDSTALKPTNVTVEAWVWLDPSLPSNHGGEHIVFKKNTWSAWFEGYSLLKYTIDNGDGTFSDRFQFCVSRNGDQVAINSKTIVQRGVWYHVAATYDGNQSILYVNGVEEASATPGFALDYDTTPIYIGTTGTWAPYLDMFGGIIDEVSIYNRALTAGEIQAIYNAGANGKCSESTTSNLPPVITQQPTNQIFSLGGTAHFSVVATGSAPLQYQWYHQGSYFLRGPIPGATNATLTLSNLQPANLGIYFVVVSNLFGSVTSSNVALALAPSGPQIYLQPTNQLVPVGGVAQFTVGATTILPLNGPMAAPAAGIVSPTALYYQWYFRPLLVGAFASQIPGATSATLTLSNVQPSNAGNYFVVVSNFYGSAISSNALLIVIGETNSGSCTPPPSGLVGWWPGESNADDVIGGDNGTLEGGATFAPGKVGEGFRLDGTNGFVRIPDSTALKPTNVTVEAWVWLDPNLPSTNGGEQIVFKKNTWSAWFEGYSLSKQTIDNGNGTSSDRFQFCISHSGNQVAINSQTIAHRGVWYHVAATYDGNQSILYVNGVEEASATPGFALDYDTTPIYIGTTGTWAPYLNMFGGIIDEVSIYNRALTAGEIQAIYNAGANGKCTSSTTSNLPPAITQQPTNQTVATGGTASFSVKASGSPTLNYQWWHGSSGPFVVTPILKIIGATNSTLTLSNVQPAQAGGYFVVVTNPYGETTSSNAVLTVTAAPPPTALVQVVNTSAQAGTTFDVPIILVAKGNENALSFSLDFDAHAVTYSNTVLGTNASNGLILLNSSQASNGVLGVALALPSGQTFSPGTQQVARVTFSAPLFTGIEPLVTPANFADQPVARLLSDAGGDSLDVVFSNSFITILPGGFEGDAAPRPSGDGKLNLFDWVQVGRFVAGLDTISNASEFQRVDCAPRSTLGDGQIKVTDWVQAGRYATGLDPLTPVGGPTGPIISNVPLAVPRVPVSRQVTIGSSSTVKGLTTTVPITLQAQGNESALAFSLSFDPSVLKYVSTARGSAATAATLIVNANQAASGKLAIVLCLPSGSYFSAGLDEIAKATFVAIGTGTNSTVSFADQPVFRSISDTNAVELPANYVANPIAVNPHPTVNAVPAGKNSVFSWPIWAGDFTLQAASNLTPPIHWTNVPVTLQTNGNKIQVTVPAPTGLTFYRLYHP